MESQPNPYKDMPAEVRLICAQTDLKEAVNDLSRVWGLTGAETLLVVNSVLGTLSHSALESMTGNVARSIAAAKNIDPKPENAQGDGHAEA